VFRERLRNKATRLTAAQGLVLVAESGGFDLSPFLQQNELQTLCDNLRQSDREFSRLSARLLELLIRAHPASVDAQAQEYVLSKCKEHLAEQAALGERMSFQLSASVVDVLSACLAGIPASAAVVGGFKEHVLALLQVRSVV
jgi:hypothetical protein